MRIVVWPFLLLLALGVGSLAACGDDDGQQPATPTRTPTASQGETIEISALGDRFDVDLIVVDSGDPVIIEFTNNDAVPHNIAVYETAAAEVEIFVGDTFSGPEETETYEFDAPPESGTYFYRCDVHPTEMIGDFQVQ